MTPWALEPGGSGRRGSDPLCALEFDPDEFRHHSEPKPSWWRSRVTIRRSTSRGDAARRPARLPERPGDREVREPRSAGATDPPGINRPIHRGAMTARERDDDRSSGDKSADPPGIND